MEIDSLDLSGWLSFAGNKINQSSSQLNISTTTEQIREVLSELIDTVQTRQDLIEQRFDTSRANSSRLDSSDTDMQMFNVSIDPKSILASGRKLFASSVSSAAPTGKKNVSFLPVNHRLSSSSVFNSPDVRRAFARSPVRTPHHLRPPLFSHSGRSGTLSPQSEHSFNDEINLSKVSSVDDFADALEITEFVNEEQILNALERSRLLDPTMSFCHSSGSSMSSPEKSIHYNDPNKDQLEQLLGKFTFTAQDCNTKNSSFLFNHYEWNAI
jgi:hypothetical protein